MSIFLIAGLSISVAAVILVLKELKPEFTILVSTAFGIIVIASLYTPVKEIILSVYSVSDKAGIDNDIISPIIKIVGISLITEFASSICTDAGQAGIASKVENAGKITILAFSVPIITQVFDIILNLLN